MNLDDIKKKLENDNDNYYENVVLYIKALIAEGKKDEAFDLLKEEISQPYVPQATLKELEDIFDNVYVAEVVNKQISIEDAREGLLRLSIDNIVQNMFTLNLRMLADEIIFYLENSDDYLSMSMLLYTLIDQGVNMNFTLTKFGVTNTYNTLDINIIDEETMLKYSELFEKEFDKNPVYAKYCIDILSFYYLVTFPFKVDNDFELYSEVVNYVKKVSGIEELENHPSFIDIIEYAN